MLLKIAAGGQVAFSACVGAFETRVNRNARALCLHVNRRPRSQPASQPASRPASSPALLGLLPLRPLFPLPRQFQSASLDVDVSPRRSPSQQHILARLMRTTYTNTLALERLTSRHWNAEGVPLRAEGALLCRDMHPPPVQHPPPIRRADRRNAPKGAQKRISK